MSKAVVLLCLAVLIAGCASHKMQEQSAIDTQQTAVAQLLAADSTQQQVAVPVVVSAADSMKSKLEANPLYRESFRMHAVLDSTQAQVDSLANKLKEVSAGFDSYIHQPDMRIADNKAVDDILSQLSGYQAQLGNLGEFIRRLEEQIESGISQYDQPVAMLALLKPVSKQDKAVMQPQPTQPVMPKQEVVVPSSPQTQALYAQARDLYEQDNWEEAADKFQSFLRNYPQHELTVNAQYWLGECYYSLKVYNKAIQSFQKVVAEYPQSEKAADALLKQALCYMKLGNKQDARALLTRIHSEYPDYARMSLADKYLNQLK